MNIQFIINDKGERTAAIVPINEYEDLLHKCHINLELTDDYKSMMGTMIQEENEGLAQYSSLADFKNRKIAEGN